MVNNLKDRTKRFAVDVIRYCSQLPNKPEYRVVGNQLMRAGTSVGANYRAACRSKSKADFINKLSIVEEEADESEYWLELLAHLPAVNQSELDRLKDEANQLVAIMVQSKKTARAASS
jgi:four helix bundle protein